MVADFSLPFVRRYGHLRRYRQILRVLAKHGFGYLIDQLGLARHLGWPGRALGRFAQANGVTLPEHLRLALEELGPTFIKLGQILSTRPDLISPEYAMELAKLQDEVPPFASEQARAEIERELGKPLEEIFAEFQEAPLGAASLGQVHPARLKDGREVVVKVQRPHIERAIKVDLEILLELAYLAQERTPLGQVYDLPGIVREFADVLWHELDYELEGHNADRFRRNFFQEEMLYIPRVYWDYTTRKVLTLERIRGVKINDFAALDAAGFDRYRIAENSTRIILKELFEDGFFHADPHPGNFLVMEGEVIGAMDFGMVGYIDEETRHQLLRLLMVYVQGDASGITRELKKLGFLPKEVDSARLEKDLERFLTKYYGQPLKEYRAREIIDDVAPIAFRHHVRLPAQLWLLAKTAAMLEGLGVQLAPELDVYSLARPFMQRALRQMASPSVLGRRMVRSTGEWGELLVQLPGRTMGLVDQLERGELGFSLRWGEAESFLAKLDRIANRLAVSVLIAAFIVALAILVPPLYASVWQEGRGVVLILLVALGLISAGGLGLWLLYSIWRSGRS